MSIDALNSCGGVLSLGKRSTGSRALLLVVLLASLLVSCTANRTKLAYTEPDQPDWITPRANAANTGYLPAGIVNEPYTIAWSTRTGGVAACEPLVRDGLIFFSGLDRRVEVFDLVTGERKFRKRFDGPVLGVIAGDSTFGVLVDQVERRFITFDLRTAREQSGFKVSNASAPPRPLGDTAVLIGTWHGTLYCFGTDGTVVWKSHCEGPILSAPAIVDSIIYVGSGRSVYALRSGNGSILWKYSATGAIEGAPAIGQFVYVAAADSFAAALDRGSGALVWKTRLGGGAFSSPAIGRDAVYFTSNDGVIAALGIEDGAKLWSYSIGGIANLSPTVCDDFVLATARQATISVLDAQHGSPLWTDTSLSAQAATSPIVIGDRILLTDARRTLICLAPASKVTVTRFED